MAGPYVYAGIDRTPTPSMINNAADSIGVSPAVMQAVIRVEAGGKWYNGDGSMVRRFEPHHGTPRIKQELSFRGNWRDSLKIKTSSRRKMFDRAYAVDPEGACRASSWGAFQIMGFNAERSGFKSARDMVKAFAGSIEAQLRAFINFVKFIKADGDLRAQNWTGFARKYNGSGQPAVYGKKLASAYASITGSGSPKVLRLGSKGATVTELQKALATRGYPVGVDGYFGAETYESVLEFQKAESLTADGMVGAMTWQQLRQTSAYSPKPELTQTISENLSEKVAVASAALTTGTGAVTTVLGDAPSDAVRISLIAAIVVLAGVGGFAYLWMKKSKKDRLVEYRFDPQQGEFG